MRRRLIVIAALFLLAFLGIGARLVGIQWVEHERWSQYAQRIQEEAFAETGPRGRILDRNGLLFAQDLPATSIALDNYHMSQPEVLIELLQRHLGISRQALADKVYQEGYFTWIARQVDLSVADALQAEVQAAGADGLIFVPDAKRVYPQQSLASNVIGFTGLDHQGLEGVELSYDALLSGGKTQVRVLRTGTGIELVRSTEEQTRPGSDVVLTLDGRIQRIAEEELDAGLKRFKAKDGFIVILDPQSGELLAMAQAKRYNLNDYRQSSAAQRFNEAVARAYEPGSLFKVFAGLAALETGAVSLGEAFDGDTKIKIAGHAFGNAEANVKFGRVNLKGIIQNSVNIGMIQVARRVGERAFYDYLLALDFGRPTGVGLPGEIGGSLIPVEKWSPLEIASISIGQAVSVTGLQLASRLAAIGNDGVLMQPYVLLETRSLDGSAVQRAAPRAVERVASSANARLMVDMMIAVVEKGTGTAAQLDGFSVAAKSGTAQKALPGQGYSPDKFISSFGGFFPAHDPRFLVLVVLDEVQDQPVWGGRTAASVFKEIAKRLIALEKLHPQR